MIDDAIRFYSNIVSEGVEALKGAPSYSVTFKRENKGQPIDCGITNSTLPDEYKIKIINTRFYRGLNDPSNPDNTTLQNSSTITGLMQKPIRFETKSTWSELSSDRLSLANDVSQLVVGFSFMGKFASRRVWQSTSPIRFNITLEFIAENNIENEVTQPIKEILKLPLPVSFYDNESILGKLGVFAPGPNPFQITNKVDGTSGLDRFSETTDIAIGTQWYFSNVIVKNSIITQYPYFSESNGAVRATADVDFETYEIYTKNDINTACMR